MEEHRDGERGRRERIFYKMCCSCIHILGSSPALWSSFTVLWILLTWSMGEKVKHLLRNSSAFKDVLFCFSQYILTICPELKSASVIRLNSGYSLNLPICQCPWQLWPQFLQNALERLYGHFPVIPHFTRIRNCFWMDPTFETPTSDRESVKASTYTAICDSVVGFLYISRFSTARQPPRRLLIACHVIHMIAWLKSTY